MSLSTSTRWSLLIALVSLVAIVGCRATGPLKTTDPRLGDVNEAMTGETLRLFLKGRTDEVDVSQVQLSADSIYYVEASSFMQPETDRSVVQRPVEDVDSLQIKYNGGGGVVGALIGAVPGTVIAVNAHFKDRDCESIECGLTKGFGQVIGVGVALIGMGVGALIGNAVDEDVQTVYRRPVEQYLGDPPVDERQG